MAILLKDKQAKILLLLKNGQQVWHITDLAKSSQATYVHTHNFIKLCQTMGIASVEKHGKIKDVKLTEKGMQIADMVNSIYSALSQQQQPPPKPEEKKEDKK